MSEIIKCEYCDRVISHEDLNNLYAGDNSKVDGKLLWTGGPIPEPDRDAFWHVKCDDYKMGPTQEQE